MAPAEHGPGPAEKTAGQPEGRACGTGRAGTEQQMQMWVPRQCQGMLRLEMQLVEVAGASSSQASTVPAMVATAGEAQHDRNVEGMYANGRRWG